MLKLAFPFFKSTAAPPEDAHRCAAGHHHAVWLSQNGDKYGICPHCWKKWGFSGYLAKSFGESPLDGRLEKAHVKGHYRTVGGKRVWVREHEDKRGKHTQPHHLARPTLTPGEDYAQNGTRSKAFKAWFGPWETDPEKASKVVNEDGSPKVVYHGTQADFTEFSFGALRSATNHPTTYLGFFFTEDRIQARKFSGEKFIPVLVDENALLQDMGLYDIWFSMDGPSDEQRTAFRDEYAKRQKVRIETPKSSHTLSVYLRIRKPFTLTFKQWCRHFTDPLIDETEESDERVKSKAMRLRQWLKHRGYDGIHFLPQGKPGKRGRGEYAYDTWIAFSPTQIKSADNAGTFSPDDADIRKSFRFVFPQSSPLDGQAWSAEMAELRKAAKKAKKLDFGETSASGERWVTVHPHGDDEKGMPVLLQQNPDGTYTVKGGAGGTLNGLRMTDVKTHDEYKNVARQRAVEKREKAEVEKEARFSKLSLEHAKKVSAEAMESGTQLDKEQIAKIAAKRAHEELKEERKAKTEEQEKLVVRQVEKQQDKIAEIAKAQGWEGYELSDEAIGKAREAASKKILSDNPELAFDLQHGDDKDQKQAKAKLSAKIGKAVERVKKIHHAQLYRRAKEVERNLRDTIVTAHEDIQADTLGDLAVGDLVQSTMGDTGKGFIANLQDEAERRGMDIPAAHVEAAAQGHQSLIERHGGDMEKVAQSVQMIDRFQRGAQQSRQAVAEIQAQLGEMGESLEKIKGLDTMPKAASVEDAVKVLSSLKAHDAELKAIRNALSEVEASTIDTLPKAAVVEAVDFDPEKARKLVANDLGESRRQRSMSALLEAYNAQDAATPIREHRLTGHVAYLSNVSHLTGVHAPDPVMIDTLGESGTAHVMRRALELSGADMQGIRGALAEHHVATQVAIADAATLEATELFNAADNVEIMPIESVDEMLAGLTKNEQKLELVRQGRKKLGLALGRLEAAGALNEALMGKSDGKERQVSLGAVSMKDAVVKAHALGLGEADTFDANGNLVKQGDFQVYNDGKNKVLILHQAGLDRLANSVMESPEHAQRVKLSNAIRTGQHDEQGWLPKGFSPRPEINVSAGGSWNVPHSPLDVDLSEAKGADDIAESLREYIAARKAGTGHEPGMIWKELLSAEMRNGTPKGMHQAYDDALDMIVPPFKPSKAAKTDRSLRAMEQVEWNKQRDATLNSLAEKWIDNKVSSGEMTADEASVHKQSVPQNWQMRDLLYQSVLQDPRLQYAYIPLGNLGDRGRRAVREYAFEHYFPNEERSQADPVWQEEQLTGLSTATDRANKLGSYPAYVQHEWSKLLAQGLDPYTEIQKHWRESSVTPIGMFGETPEPHDFATVDLNDDVALIAAAKKRPEELNYTEKKRVDTDIASGTYREIVPKLEVSDTRSEKTIADEVRGRIKERLRDYAYRNMMHVRPEGMEKLTGYDPDKTPPASERWARYMSAMGGGTGKAEERAYQTIQEKMQGELAERFAKGFKQWTGHDFQTVAVPLKYFDAHMKATMSAQDYEKAKKLLAEAQSKKAKVQARRGSKFVKEQEGALALKMDIAGQDQLSAFGEMEGMQEEPVKEAHRLSLGSQAEGMIAGMMPKINLKKGTVAAGDIDMSTGDNILRQRAIKGIAAMGRSGLTYGTGSGKTTIALGAHSYLKSTGAVKRSIMAVPSVVQEQFGSEGARFYDPTDPNMPSVYADSKGSAADRRAAYSDQSGHDVVVVTHQALRDDLTWALSQHQFGGDTAQAQEFLRTAPEHERNETMKDAVSAQGWNFDMSVVDEGHNLLNRKGKENSMMANAIDSFTHDKKYHVSMSADPVKNDASEVFDFLHKVAPQRYMAEDYPGAGQRGVVTRGEFMRKYAVNTPAVREALSREMEPYHLTGHIKPPVERQDKTHTVSMTPDQQTEYNRMLKMYQRARGARKKGEVDVEAVKTLSPGSFENIPEAEHEAIAKRLQKSVGILRDSALDRVVNSHPSSAKMDWLDSRLKDMPADKQPTIIFSHSLSAVSAIADHLKKQGVRVAVLQGSMRGDAKEAAKLDFSPAFDSNIGKYVTPPKADVLVSSDAGSVGINAQRATHVINWDTPHTSMTHEQRAARAHRIGQRNDVVVDTVVTDSPYEKRRQERLARKADLREALTRPTAEVDDSGLAETLARHVDKEREDLVQRSVDALRKAA